MVTGETLILEATDFIDPQHWRWVLKDSQGKFLADQEVDLDPADPNYSAFINLEGFLKVNSSPDKWLEDQIRLMQQMGYWIGKEALGVVGERIAKFSTPLTVRVQVPTEASGLLYRPWEMASSGLWVHLDLVDIQGGQPPFHDPVQVSEANESSLMNDDEGEGILNGYGRSALFLHPYLPEDKARIPTGRLAHESFRCVRNAFSQTLPGPVRHD